MTANLCSVAFWNLDNGLLNDLSNENQDALQEAVCGLAFLLKDKDPDTMFCSHTLHGLGCLNKHGLLDNLSEVNRHALREAICGLSSLLEEKNSPLSGVPLLSNT